MTDDLQKKLDDLVKNSSFIIATPDTIDRMKERGLPIKSTFQTYEEYLDKLFVEKRKIADEVISKLPLLDDAVANATAQALYNELRECFVLGIPGAGITLAIILFEYACRHRLFIEKRKSNPNASWSNLEKKMLSQTLGELKALDVVNQDDFEMLMDFNKTVRNNYLHYNIGKLVKNMTIAELPSVKIDTGEVVIEKNVDIKNKPWLWFSAKRVLDRDNIVPIADFCIHWANKLLSYDGNS